MIIDRECGTFVRHLTAGLGFAAVALGSALIGGGPSHAVSPSFHTMNMLGGPYPWGAGFVLGGLWLLAAWWSQSPRGLSWALLACASLYVFMALGFAYAALPPRFGAWTGTVTYMALGLLHAGLTPLDPVRAGAGRA